MKDSKGKPKHLKKTFNTKDLVVTSVATLTLFGGVLQGNPLAVEAVVNEVTDTATTDKTSEVATQESVEVPVKM